MRHVQFYCSGREYQTLAYWAEAAGYNTVETWLAATLTGACHRAKEGGRGDAPPVGAAIRPAPALG